MNPSRGRRNENNPDTGIYGQISFALARNARPVVAITIWIIAIDKITYQKYINLNDSTFAEKKWV
jgi:hypothetical protein